MSAQMAVTPQARQIGRFMWQQHFELTSCQFNETMRKILEILEVESSAAFSACAKITMAH